MNFDSPRLAASELFHGMEELLTSFSVACDVAATNITSGKLAPGPRDGKAWNIWVYSLTQVAREFGLPEGVSNDFIDMHSPFVRLVKELEAQLPAEVRKKRLSDHALAKAINRARHEIGT